MLDICIMDDDENYPTVQKGILIYLSSFVRRSVWIREL